MEAGVHVVPAGSGGDRAGEARERFTFLDGLRGVAIILMVVNHTSRWWIDVSMGWPRYWLVYGSMLLPAALFLFLVGFCLPMPLRRRPGVTRPRFAEAMPRYLRRGSTIILAGLLLNLLAFHEDPLWTAGVLQTIGLSIILVAPAMWIVDRPWARWALAALAIGTYLAFVAAYPALGRWSPSHPVAARILFWEFPPWPWVAVTLIGLVAGWLWIDARERGARAERRYFLVVTVVGLACVAAYLAWEVWLPTTPRFGFPRDFLLNRRWTPRGVTTLLVAGGVALLLAGAWWTMQVKRRRLPWLVVLGQTALMIYFVHHLIVLTLVNQALGLRFNHWGLYWTANAVLMVVLLGLGHGWLEAKRLWRRRGAAAPAAPITS